MGIVSVLIGLNITESFSYLAPQVSKLIFLLHYEKQLIVSFFEKSHGKRSHISSVTFSSFSLLIISSPSSSLHLPLSPLKISHSPHFGPQSCGFWSRHVTNYTHMHARAHTHTHAFQEIHGPYETYLHMEALWKWLDCLNIMFTRLCFLLS